MGRSEEKREGLYFDSNKRINRSVYRGEKVSKNNFFSLALTKVQTYLNEYIFNCWLA